MDLSQLGEVTFPLPIIDNFSHSWESAAMEITTIDEERRLVLPGAMPGEIYAVWQNKDGHYELTKVAPAPKQTKNTPEDLDALLISAALTPKMSWQELRSQTRAP